MQALSEEFGLPCGYFVEYAWTGKGDVTFLIDTDSSKMLSLSALAVLGGLALLSY